VGSQAKVVDARGQVSAKPCAAKIVVDGAGMYFEINDVPPVEIGAIEAYPAAPIYPMEYGGAPCGLIIIWTKR